jgi:hypothetical protein
MISWRPPIQNVSRPNFLTQDAGATVLEAFNLATGRPAYRVVFDFLLKIFGVFPCEEAGERADCASSANFHQC